MLRLEYRKTYQLYFVWHRCWCINFYYLKFRFPRCIFSIDKLWILQPHYVAFVNKESDVYDHFHHLHAEVHVFFVVQIDSRGLLFHRIIYNRKEWERLWEAVVPILVNISRWILILCWMYCQLIKLKFLTIYFFRKLKREKLFHV